MFEFTKDRVKSAVASKMRFAQVDIAFQPIVDANSARVWGYEALTRGADGQTYPEIVANMNDRKRMAFDKLTMLKALRQAARMGLVLDGAKITLNVRPTVDHAAVDAAFVARAAKHYGIPLESIVLELTEDAKLSCDDFLKVVAMHREVGIATGIDDFGSGYSGLNVLATCGADMVKLDQHLIHGIDTDVKKQIIVESFARLCGKLGSLVVAEGVETEAEAETLREQGIGLMQGYYFGHPAVGVPSVLRTRIGAHEAPRTWSLPVKSWSMPFTLQA